MADIQILIAAFGPDAIERISALHHAVYPGVEYLVSWQNYDRNRIPESIADRQDFKIHFENSTGLCNNRNALLHNASADIVAIADDDLIYEVSHIKNLIEGFKKNPDCHFLTFRYASDKFPKTYPPETFDITRPPKGYFVTSMELAFNLKKIREDYKGELPQFDPAFGVNGSLFPCGEEDILIHSMLRRGMKGRFIPADICINTDSTTAERIGNSRQFIETKGAVMRIVKPSTRYLRMLTHAWRSHTAQGLGHVSFLAYCRWWIAGEKKLKGLTSNFRATDTHLQP